MVSSCFPQLTSCRGPSCLPQLTSWFQGMVEALCYCCLDVEGVIAFVVIVLCSLKPQEFTANKSLKLIPFLEKLTQVIITY